MSSGGTTSSGAGGDPPSWRARIARRLRARGLWSALWLVGTVYTALVVMILLAWPDEITATLSRPGARFAMWLVGAAQLVVVTVRWWVTAWGKPVPAPATMPPVAAPDADAPVGPAPAAPATEPGEHPAVLERLFAWLFAYPLFPLQIGLLWAISWLGFGSGVGMPDLMWDDVWLWRFFAGVAVALLFVNVLVVRYMLDRRPGTPGARAEVPPGAAARRWSLFRFARDGATVRLGTYLWWWPFALAVFYAPKMAAKDYWKHYGDLCPGGDVWHFYPGGMLAGLLTGVAIVLFTVWYFDRAVAAPDRDEEPVWGKGWTPGAIGFVVGVSGWLFDHLPGFAGDQIHPTQRRLHVLAARFLVIPAAVLALFVTLRLFGAVVWHPVWIVCLLLGLFNSLYGLVTFHFAGLQYVLLLLCALLGVVCNTNNADKMSFPGLDAPEVAERPVDLDDLGANDAAVAELKLVDTRKMLGNFHKKWAPGAEPNQKPKLVIVANSGGGIRAAVWTAVVLERLENDEVLRAAGAGGFRNHIRMLTGASGGMLGAGLYAADFESIEERRAGRRPMLADQLARDSLWPTFQTMFMSDLPAVGVPFSVPRDRGRSLEDAWVENTRPEPLSRARRVMLKLGAESPRTSPLQKTFAELNAPDAEGVGEEERCARPSLVFSPMLVEDCRRLLITNLDLGGQTHLSCATLNTPIGTIPEDRQSVPVVEFWRAFPGVYRGTGFQIKTAARMSATFPFVGPGVSLPTVPRRRVVDAGYFDNFGINLAAVWLYRYRKEIIEHTSGVVIVEIRAYPRRKEKLLADPTRDGAAHAARRRPELFTWALSEMSTPAEAVINLYARAAYFRNDVQLDVLNELYNTELFNTRDNIAAAHRNQFLTTVVFECDQEAALSWTMPESDYRDIRGNVDRYAPEIRRLREWFGRGGTRPGHTP